MTVTYLSRSSTANHLFLVIELIHDMMLHQTDGQLLVVLFHGVDDALMVFDIYLQFSQRDP